MKTRERPGAKRLLGIVLLILLLCTVLVLPAYGLILLLTTLTGATVGAGLVMLGAFIWFILLYGIVCCVMYLIHRFVPHQHRNEKYDEVLSALDRITSGDFNVFVEADERMYFGKMAGKINHMAKQLASMEQMRQDFVANVSHEIQSPLTSINGFAALLEKEDVTPAQKTHYLGIIQAETSRLSKLGENLLKLSVLDSESLQTNPSMFRLDKQLGEVLLLLEPQWSAKSLEVSLEAEESMCFADKDLLEQVWINLVHNAIKFTPEGGSIAVALHREDGDTLCIRVKDTGPGIAQEHQLHIFERFYKADKARSSETGGSGLGLSLVHRIVSLHNGRVSLQSPEGEGAVFTVEIPSV